MVFFLVSCAKETKVDNAPVTEYHRIISFAPSITETLFALGLGNRVVGVTRFCNYPPEVKSIPKIGGYLDPNYEMILSLKPDLVLLLQEHSQLVYFLKKNNIHYERIGNENLEAILNSFSIIGRMCGKTLPADSLVAQIKGEIVHDTINLRKPRILVCIGRDNPGSGNVSKAYIAGPKTFYNDLLRCAGGTNAFSDTAIAYPELSAEGIMRIAPDIIIDLMAAVVGINEETVRNDWKKLRSVPAVKNKMVFCPANEYVSIPGPRVAFILHDLKQIISVYRDRIGT
jgi:iron complex transport system substrate-binding protein